MIRLCEGALPTLPFSEASVRIGCLTRAYAGTSVVRCWSDDAGNLLCLTDGHAVWQTAEVTPEWVLFIAMQPEILSVCTDAASAAALADALDGTVEVGEVLELPVAVSPRGAVEEVLLRDLYPVLQAGFGEAAPNFEPWYADAMLRMRRGLCRAVAVQGKGVPVSVAMTVAETETGAVVGGVATMPAYRRRGFAADAVATLAASLQAEGKRVLICPKNEPAARLYASLGFVPFARRGVFYKNAE